MTPSENQITNELKYIEEHFEASTNFTPEIREYLMDNDLIELDNDTDLIFLTIEGELFLGADKLDLQEKYGDEYKANETYSDETEEGEQENDYDF